MVHIQVSEAPGYAPVTFGSVPVIYSPLDLVFVSGGGPSIRNVDLTRCRHRVAATNTALDFPGAQILFWSDLRWYRWNFDRIRQFPGLKFTRSRPPYDIPHIQRLRYRPGVILSDDPDAVSGMCSGSGALNIAYLAGARDIVLIGFDMRDTEDWRASCYHADHKSGPVLGRMDRTARPAMDRMIERLVRKGVRVRVAGESALAAGKVEFDAAIAEADRSAR